MSDPGYELVRCSRAMVDQLVDRESEPVVVIALKRLEDGTCEMWLRASDVAAEVERLREALKEITNWAEAARGHYGIEESSGPGQERTEWDEIQDGLRASALFAREALEAGER